ncbi:hypothetical protein XELAEV_18030643mg [Xenopus laevis]|uniref:Uncharacterized protein n=1 Tax=Xenopus laevis TaxID=8355 RepID=A0A974CL72_XENLA|nr:hypothetical protein XELAEV_18030643mg [Xenopus laevis]
MIGLTWIGYRHYDWIEIWSGVIHELRPRAFSNCIETAILNKNKSDAIQEKLITHILQAARIVISNLWKKPEPPHKKKKIYWVKEFEETKKMEEPTALKNGKMRQFEKLWKDGSTINK